MYQVWKNNTGRYCQTNTCFSIRYFQHWSSSLSKLYLIYFILTANKPNTQIHLNAASAMKVYLRNKKARWMLLLYITGLCMWSKVAPHRNVCLFSDLQYQELLIAYSRTILSHWTILQRNKTYPLKGYDECTGYSQHCVDFSRFAFLKHVQSLWIRFTKLETCNHREIMSVVLQKVDERINLLLAVSISLILVFCS